MSSASYSSKRRKHERDKVSLQKTNKSLAQECGNPINKRARKENKRQQYKCDRQDNVIQNFEKMDSSNALIQCFFQGRLNGSKLLEQQIQWMQAKEANDILLQSDM